MSNDDQTSAYDVVLADLIARREALDRAQRAEHSFKNFHRNVCDAANYVHDETDWERDLASLTEHVRQQSSKIAELEKALSKAAETFADMKLVAQMLHRAPVAQACEIAEAGCRASLASSGEGATEQPKR